MMAVLSAFLVADLWQFSLQKVWPMIITAIIILLIIGWLFREKLIWLMITSVIFFFLALILANYQTTKYQPPADFANRTTITGMVVERPQLDDKQKIVVDSEDYRILVNLPRYPEYKYGDTLKINGKLELPTIFDDFNYRNYLEGKQIYLVINRADSIEITGFEGGRIKSWLYQTADKFETALNKSLTEPEAAFAAGLLLGSKRGLPDSLTEQMQNSGTSHLVAISGYNITVIIVTLMMLLMILGRRNAFIITLLVTIGFVILTGGSASVVRGAIVGLIALFARVIDRRANQTNLLLLSATIILLFNPLMLLYDYGFLLSFTAFAGLIYISPLFDYLFKKDKYISKIPDFISGVLKETLSAQVMTLPLLLFAFGKFSLMAPISNVLILPMIPLVMFLTLVIGLAGMVTSNLGIITGYLGWVFLWYPLKIIEFFGKLKFAAVDFGKNAFWIVLVGYAIIVLIIYKSRRLYKRYVQLF